jgi:hypothetical protein
MIKIQKVTSDVSINKRLGSLNTTFYFDLIKKGKKQLHVSAHGHHQVGSFGLGEKILFATPCWVSQFTMIEGVWDKGVLTDLCLIL